MGVGAPSYTSGAQTWKGAEAILKKRPQATRIIPTTRSGDLGPRVIDFATPARERLPVAPNTSERP